MRIGLAPERILKKKQAKLKTAIIMGNVCKAGAWLFRINPKNDRELQKASTGSSSYSFLWSAPNGEHILEISAKGEDVFIETDRHNYVRMKSGGIVCR